MQKIIMAIAAVVLVGCGASSGVLEVGPNRYRATEETRWSVGDAENRIIVQAQAHCAGRGQRANVAMQNTQPATSWSYAIASAEFSCAQR